MRRFIGVFLAAVLALTVLAGCAGGAKQDPGGADPGTGSGDKIVIGLSEPNAGWPYISAYMNAFAEAAKAYPNVEVVALSADGDIQKQANDIDDLIAQKVDIILVCSLDGKAIVPSLKKAHDAGIPILAVSNEPDPSGDQYLAGFSGPDDEEQGRIAARILAKALNNEGNIVIIEGTPGQSTTHLRNKGFEEEMQQIAPGITVLAKQTANWDPAEAKSVMENFITRYGSDIDAVFAQDDNTGAAAAEVLKEANMLPPVLVVGTGGTKNGLAAIRSGLMYGTMDQSPTTDAKQGLELALKIVAGEQLEQHRNIIPMPEITTDNVDEFEGEW